MSATICHGDTFCELKTSNRHDEATAVLFVMHFMVPKIGISHPIAYVPSIPKAAAKCTELHSLGAKLAPTQALHSYMRKAAAPVLAHCLSVCTR